LKIAALALIISSTLSAASSTPIIIDTDCGRDDLMAIAFLLERRDVRIEAVTVANGLAHVRAGAENILRLLELAGQGDVPVFIGRDTPLSGHAAFPDAWRKGSDELMRGVSVRRQPEKRAAADYLAVRLRDHGRPVRILALGPLTNLAEAMDHVPGGLSGVEIVIMGGAIRVPGNLGDGGAFKTMNTTAEWNLFVDPLAGQRVFNAGAKILLVPLDATNQVPVDLAFVRDLRARGTPLGNSIAGLLERECNLAQSGSCYAWDALAAVALADPGVVSLHSLAIEIRQKPPEEGRTAEVDGKSPNANVALGADATAFRKAYLGAFNRAGSATAGP
jgi:pyrimidine-specific ribonucleoside hydrolase